MITRTVGIAYNGYIDSETNPELVKPTKRQAIAYLRGLTTNKVDNFDFWSCSDNDGSIKEDGDEWELSFREILYAEVTREEPFTLEDIAEDEEVNVNPVVADRECFNSMFFSRKKVGEL